MANIVVRDIYVVFGMKFKRSLCPNWVNFKVMKFK
jgi:hypothetical protein